MTPIETACFEQARRNWRTLRRKYRDLPANRRKRLKAKRDFWRTDYRTGLALLKCLVMHGRPVVAVPLLPTERRTTAWQLWVLQAEADLESKTLLPELQADYRECLQIARAVVRVGLELESYGLDPAEDYDLRPPTALWVVRGLRRYRLAHGRPTDDLDETCAMHKRVRLLARQRHTAKLGPGEVAERKAAERLRREHARCARPEGVLRDEQGVPELPPWPVELTRDSLTQYLQMADATATECYYMPWPQPEAAVTRYQFLQAVRQEAWLLLEALSTPPAPPKPSPRPPPREDTPVQVWARAYRGPSWTDTDGVRWIPAWCIPYFRQRERQIRRIGYKAVLRADENPLGLAGHFWGFDLATATTP